MLWVAERTLGIKPKYKIWRKKMFKKIDKEKVDDYIFHNEQVQENGIICPYCKKNQKYNSKFLYQKRFGKKFKCKFCKRVFKVSSGFNWWFSCMPIPDEVEKILRD